MWDNRNYGFHPDQKIASVRPGSVKGEASENGRRRGDGKRKEGGRDLMKEEKNVITSWW